MVQLSLAPPSPPRGWVMGLDWGPRNCEGRPGLREELGRWLGEGLGAGRWARRGGAGVVEVHGASSRWLGRPPPCGASPAGRWMGPPPSLWSELARPLAAAQPRPAPGGRQRPPEGARGRQRPPRSRQRPPEAGAQRPPRGRPAAARGRQRPLEAARGGTQPIRGGGGRESQELDHI